MISTNESIQDSTKPCTPGAVLVLYRVLDAALGHKPVARHLDGNVVYGTARRVGDEQGCTSDADLRDQFLWVTLNTGFEAFWPVKELALELFTGEFADDYQPPVEVR